MEHIRYKIRRFEEKEILQDKNVMEQIELSQENIRVGKMKKLDY